MLERRVIDYLDRKERGTVRPVPDAFDFACPDRPAAGRLIVPGVTPPDHRGLTFEEAGDRTDIAWEPPRPSTAGRQISLKSVSSVLGHMIDIARNRLLTFESLLEYLFSNMLLAWRDITLVEDQPPELKFHLDGKPCKYTFDFRSTDVRNFIAGYAVKPADQLERDQTMRKVKAIEAVHALRDPRHRLNRQVSEDRNSGWKSGGRPTGKRIAMSDDKKRLIVRIPGPQEDRPPTREDIKFILEVIEKYKAPARVGRSDLVVCSPLTAWRVSVGLRRAVRQTIH